jgi:two-component system, NtrC family, response regulator HydG
MAEPATLLIADDDPGLRESLERALTREGYRVVLASDGRAALERVQAGGVDLIVTDLRMPGLTGLELLRAAKAIMPDVDVILLTAFGTVEEAVKAMKDGAYDFLTKPFRREQLIKLIDKALERRDLIEQNRALKQQLEDLRAKGQMIGGSPAFRRMMTLVEQIADSSATALIQGESGTGKELVARAIHDRSGRRTGPFVAVNCAALPETLLESELFGYEKGTFTGAAGRKEGRFELASGGTLFLDEVADLSLVTQPKILRVLQEGEFERLGGTRTLQVDVRIVAATNQDLADMVKEKRFREDLYYRLNVLTIDMPPLRERGDDVQLLATYFLRKFSSELKLPKLGFHDSALEKMQRYRWPGNVRELISTVRRAVVMGEGRWLMAGDLTFSESAKADRVALPELATARQELEEKLMRDALRINSGNIKRAAKELGVSRVTFYRLMEKYRIQPDALAVSRPAVPRIVPPRPIVPRPPLRKAKPGGALKRRGARDEGDDQPGDAGS